MSNNKHYIDPDDPPDPIEAVGVMWGGYHVAPPTGCHDSNCLEEGMECGSCAFSEAIEDEQATVREGYDFRPLIKAFERMDAKRRAAVAAKAATHHVPTTFPPRFEAQLELHASAPAHRGAHVRAELGIVARKNLTW